MLFSEFGLGLNPKFEIPPIFGYNQSTNMRFNLSNDRAWGANLVYPYFGYHHYGKRLNLNCHDEYKFGYGIDLNTKIWFDSSGTGWDFELVVLGLGFRVWYTSQSDVPF